MYNGAKVDVEEKTKWHNKNFMFFFPNRNKRGYPKNEHKQSRGSPNGNCGANNEVKHDFDLLSFLDIL